MGSVNQSNQSEKYKPHSFDFERMSTISVCMHMKGFAENPVQ